MSVDTVFVISGIEKEDFLNLRLLHDELGLQVKLAISLRLIDLDVVDETLDSRFRKLQLKCQLAFVQFLLGVKLESQ